MTFCNGKASPSFYFKEILNKYFTFVEKYACLLSFQELDNN